MKAFLAVAFSTILACAAVAQGKSRLDTPSVPIAPATARQPAGALLDSPGIPGATDAAREASPVAGQKIGSGLRVGSAVSIQLSRAVDSGSSRNGDAVQGILVSPVKTIVGMTIPAGTRIEGTVVSSAKAGTLESGGVLSIQLTKVGAVPVVTDVVDFNGQEGHKDVADSAPEKGTEAMAQAGSTLQFHVLENGTVPGVIPGAKLQGGAGGGKEPAALPSGGTSGTRANPPAVDQGPIHGGSGPARTRTPGTGPGPGR